MSQTTAFESFSVGHATFLSEIATFFRRWFASETIANPNALQEVGLDHIFSHYR